MNTTKLPFNKQKARKLLQFIDTHGLSEGLGSRNKNEVCIMAAFNAVLGRPHRDNGLGDCVGSAVREFDIKLNDCAWSSNAARAKGMRREAIAKIGSNQIDQMEFGKLMFLRGTQKLLPFVFRKVATDPEVNKEHRATFLKHAAKCEGASEFKQAQQLVKAASAYASASASAYASAYAYASASAYAYASASAYAYASASAYAYAYAYASASAYAYASAYAKWPRENLGDKFLTMTAEVAVDVLIELKSPGCKWLNLCDGKAK